MALNTTTMSLLLAFCRKSAVFGFVFRVPSVRSPSEQGLSSF